MLAALAVYSDRVVPMAWAMPVVLVVMSMVFVMILMVMAVAINIRDTRI